VQKSHENLPQYSSVFDSSKASNDCADYWLKYGLYLLDIKITIIPVAKYR